MIPELYRTPEIPGPDYDWRKEPWVKGASDKAALAGVLIALAYRVEGNGDQDEEDHRIAVLDNPSALMAMARSQSAGDCVRYRVAHAIAQLIDKIYEGKL